MHILFVEFKNRVSDNNLNNYITHWHQAFAGQIAVTTPLSFRLAIIYSMFVATETIFYKDIQFFF